MTFLIAIVGRPNVGKSTLFNRLVGKKIALAQKEPGLTRDRQYHSAQLGELLFDIVDTPGLETDVNFSQKSLNQNSVKPRKALGEIAKPYNSFTPSHGSKTGAGGGAMAAEELSLLLWNQTTEALKECDLILFVLDGLDGITSHDEDLGKFIRKFGKPSLVIVNKSDVKKSNEVLDQIHSLGFGSAIPLSAEFGHGFNVLHEALGSFMQPKDKVPKKTFEEDNIDTQEIKKDKPIAISVVGRPNVGKSTLLNQIIGKERFITGPLAGLTRDAVSVDFEWQKKKLRLVDTAGLRKSAKVFSPIEKMSVKATYTSIQYAEAVLLVVDATSPLDRQDLVIAHHVLEEGRILILVVNKIDLIAEDFDKFSQELRTTVSERLPQAIGLSIIFVSALNSKNLSKIFERLFEAYERWETRISTSQLNLWLPGLIERHPPPLVQGQRIKIKYMTQIKTRPPTFMVFVNKPTDLPVTYLRYLRNSLVKEFNFEGIPVRVLTKKGSNPFIDK